MCALPPVGGQSLHDLYRRPCLRYSELMLFRDRSDGTRISKIHPMNAVMPYLMRRRNGSAVYYEKKLDVERALKYIRARTAEGATPDKYSLFGILVAAAARTLAEKPGLNRFVSGGGLYQRNHIAISFIVKKKLEEQAPESYAKVFFEPGDTLDTALSRIQAAIAEARDATEAPSARTVAFLHSIPGGKYIFTWLFRVMDRLNLAPSGLIRNDPLYASIFFANLGSLGLEAPFHHLYEWGTASMFATIGRLEQEEARGPEGSRVRHHSLSLKLTLDERISQGMYLAGAASLFARLIENPELMETPPPARTGQAG